MGTRKLLLRSDQESLYLLGEQDSHLRRVENECGVEIFLRHEVQGDELHLTIRGVSSRVQKAYRRLKERLDGIRSGALPDAEPAAPAAPPAGGGRRRPGDGGPWAAEFPNGPAPMPEDAVLLSAYGKAIRPRTPLQKEYVETILAGDMTFGIGPAGTGKTFLAVATALRLLRAREVSRIILTRPVVEAGEKLGYLPGDFYDKVNPYLKPLFDGFVACLGPDKFRLLRNEEIIEIAPLAYMRGRTLEDAFIILDEAQNTTIGQMKMFLTRMGTGSRVVVTGDVTQIDLENPRRSGLVLIEKIFGHIPDIRFVHFSERDVVRHPLVAEIVKAFDAWEKEK